MSETNTPAEPPVEKSLGETASQAESAPPGPPAPPAPSIPAYGAPMQLGPVGKVRNTGTCFLLMIVTLGIYSIFWYAMTHEEMKRHTGRGIGGVLAAILAIFVSVVMPFLSSHEVGELYERRGQHKPVTAVTGLWYLLLGWFFFVGAIVWFVKTNKALNDYWESAGAAA